MQISLVNILIAFAGGLLSFLSPCVLPLVPGYISLMSGVSIDHLKAEGGGNSRRAVIANSLAFNAGLSVIFLALGGTAGLVGAAIINNVWVRVIGGLVIIVFGLHLIGLLKIKYLYKDTREFSGVSFVGFGLLGLALGAFVGYLIRPAQEVEQLAGAITGETTFFQSSLNYVLAGAILGVVLGIIIGYVYSIIRKREQPSSDAYGQSERPSGPIGSFTLGIAFAAGWTPCIGPILGGIIGLAATSGGWKGGLILSAFYSAGLAVPFLLTGLGINQFLGFYSKFRQHLHKVEVVSGIILILIGILVMSNRVTLLSSSWLASILPNLESRLHLRGGNPPPTVAANQTFTAAPDVQFAKLDGSPFKLKDLKGRVVLLNFWATWCIPCRSEIPSLSAMQKDFDSRGLTIIGVSYDDTADLIQRFQKDIPQSYQIVLGGRDVGSQLPASPLPTTYIIDRQGRIRDKMIGERTREAFEAVIKPLLDEPSVTAQK